MNKLITSILTLSTIYCIHATQENLFQFNVQEITPAILNRMTYTWHTNSPVPLKDLRYIMLSHYDFDGNMQHGELVIHKEVVQDIQYIFSELFKIKFPIQSIKFVDEFNGSDNESMSANNTSAFYARKVANTNRWSNHSFGCAIDINPLLNPYSNNQIKALPKEGEPYLDRTLKVPGMITKGSYVYNLFKERGWEWGGECFKGRDGTIDRHHFQKIIPGLNKSTN